MSSQKMSQQHTLLSVTTFAAAKPNKSGLSYFMMKFSKPGYDCDGLLTEK